MRSQVFPEELSDYSGSTLSFQLKEQAGQVDIIDFLTSNSEWLAFMKCIAEDNVDDLKDASKHLNWVAFLQSSDVTGVWCTCSAQYFHPFAIDVARHPVPTNPFFVAIFYNAQQCLRFMLESGVDFSKIMEHGFTAYHILFSAIHFMSGEHGRTEVSEESKDLVHLFHHTLFTSEQQKLMMNSICKFGMSPLSWGVYLGLANHVECISRYYAPSTVVHSDALGLNERITVDVSEFVGQNPTFFTSPITVLLDLYGQESKLSEVKALGIFRTGSMWRLWVDALYSRNYVFTVIFLLNTLTLTAGTAVFSGAGINEYLRNRCSYSESAFPYGLLVILIDWAIIGIIGAVTIIFGLLRKEMHRRKVCYPKHPRESFIATVSWYLPCSIALPISLLLIWLYVDTNRSCAIFGEQIYSVSGCCIVLLLIVSITLGVGYLRLVSHISTLMSSLYSSMIAFTLFMAFYMLLTAVFTRMFQSSFVFSRATNSTVSRPDDVTEFFKAFYQVFLVSLNVVDNNMYVPSGDRIDLIISHVFYVMMVPVLFVNFIIGILSSIVTHVQEHRVENRYMMMLTVAEFSETCFFVTHTLMDKIFGRKPVYIKFCEPMKKHSRLIAFQDTQFGSVLRQRS